MFGWFKHLGPGLLVTAAFVGPGTLTTASRAGAEFGFSLLWAVLFSIVATIVLQEMAARLGLLSRQGLGEAIRSTFNQPVARFLACFLVVAAIAVGNAAYQAGNITGAAVGISEIAGPTTPNWVWSVLVGAMAFALLATGKFKLLERVLIALVGLMSAVFLLTAIYVAPDWSQLFQGLLRPRVPVGSELTVIALIGTTVVPYNLFLHASSVQQQWPSSMPARQALREARADTLLSVALGGLITLAIVATAAAAFYQRATIGNAGQMAAQLEPLLGPASRYAFGLGILAAGLTSAICARWPPPTPPAACWDGTQASPVGDSAPSGRSSCPSASPSPVPATSRPTPSSLLKRRTACCCPRWRCSC